MAEVSDELLAAYHALYDTWLIETATVEIDVPGYNGLSYEETEAMDDAAYRVQHLLGEEAGKNPGKGVGWPPGDDL